MAVIKLLFQQGTDIYAVDSTIFKKIGTSPATESQFLDYGTNNLGVLTMLQTSNSTLLSSFATLGSGVVATIPFDNDFGAVNTINIK